jgi:predicted RNA binding protein YcfA (HicA-like mRNA interferase family)
MTNRPALSHLLRNVSFRDLERALLRDDFVLRRQTRTGGRIYAHSNGRITIIHPHRGSKTPTRRTLASILDAVRWTEEDARRFGLL